MLGFLERLCPQRERVSVRNHAFMEKLHLDAVFPVEQQLRVNAFPALDERPEAFARAGCRKWLWRKGLRKLPRMDAILRGPMLRA
jgi:hypothetical protein